MTLDALYIKKILRIDHDFDDAFLQNQIDAAKEYIKTATGVEYSDDHLIYKNAVFFLAVHWYENRQIITDKAVNEVPYTAKMLIEQIGLTRAVANE